MKAGLFIAVICSLLCHASIAQRKSADAFTSLVASATGDLNKDGLEDRVVVMQDTVSEYAPYRMQVFLASADGEAKNVATCTGCIDPQFPNGRDGWATGIRFDTVYISNGVLSINVELLRGSYEHKFHYQGNRFVLIGYSITESDGQGKIESADFNLATGKRTLTVENYESGRIISRSTSIIKIRPLPDLRTFRPQTQDYF